MDRCARCNDLHHCRVYTDNEIVLCGPCLSLILREWYFKRQEIGGLSQS